MCDGKSWTGGRDGAGASRFVIRWPESTGEGRWGPGSRSSGRPRTGSRPITSRTPSPSWYLNTAGTAQVGTSHPGSPEHLILRQLLSPIPSRLPFPPHDGCAEPSKQRSRFHRPSLSLTWPSPRGPTTIGRGPGTLRPSPLTWTTADAISAGRATTQFQNFHTASTSAGLQSPWKHPSPPGHRFGFNGAAAWIGPTEVVFPSSRPRWLPRGPRSR